MGYISKDIAVITEPKKLSLASNPNFIIFESKTKQKTYLEVNLQVNLSPEQLNISEITISDANGDYSFRGTTNLDEVSGNIFYVDKNKYITSENIKNALLTNQTISSNFDIKIPFDFHQDVAINGSVINIKSKKAGKPYNISIQADPEAYTLEWIQNISKNNDSIAGEDINVEIELDVFHQTGIFLGSEDRLLNTSMLGTPLISIQKTYMGDPLWFELNTLMSKKTSFNRPTTDTGWFDTGTISDYRFTAKVKGKTSYPFYHSNALYVLNGYGYSLNPLDLTPYVFCNKEKIKLLSNKPYCKHIKGQKEYLNFIFEDPNRNANLGNAEYKIGVAYKLFTFGGEYITTIHEHEVARTSLGMVNTCVIDLSNTLERYPKTGKVEIVLTRNRSEISESIQLEIVPECLHRLNSFVFLNKLGGWDSFNVDTETEKSSKQSSTTYNKTRTPKHGIGDSIETVYQVDLEISHTLETDPLDTATRTWLQELVASPAIYDGSGNYIILEDAKLPISSKMDTLTLKYRLSDKYNG